MGPCTRLLFVRSLFIRPRRRGCSCRGASQTVVNRWPALRIRRFQCFCTSPCPDLSYAGFQRPCRTDSLYSAWATITRFPSDLAEDVDMLPPCTSVALSLYAPQLFPADQRIVRHEPPHGWAIACVLQDHDGTYIQSPVVRAPRQRLLASGTHEDQTSRDARHVMGCPCKTPTRPHSLPHITSLKRLFQSEYRHCPNCTWLRFPSSQAKWSTVPSTTSVPMRATLERICRSTYRLPSVQTYPRSTQPTNQPTTSTPCARPHPARFFQQARLSGNSALHKPRVMVPDDASQSRLFDATSSLPLNHSSSPSLNALTPFLKSRA